MKLLASFIVALCITLYIYIIRFLIGLAPWWLSPVILVLSITGFLHATTEVARK